jgi:hypothetical protein
MLFILFEADFNHGEFFSHRSGQFCASVVFEQDQLLAELSGFIFTVIIPGLASVSSGIFSSSGFSSGSSFASDSSSESFSSYIGSPSSTSGTEQTPQITNEMRTVGRPTKNLIYKLKFYIVLLIIPAMIGCFWNSSIKALNMSFMALINGLSPRSSSLPFCMFNKKSMT